MLAKIQKWGNSLAVRIPKGLAEDLRVSEGDAVDLRIEDRELVINPAPQKPVTLSELVSRITPDNRHEPLDFGPPRGNEVW